jgi:ABC-type transport system involved in multi-copper enzyme maturation permease subunit
VFAVLVFVVAEIAAVPSFFVGSAIMSSRVSVSVTDPGVLRAIIGVGLYIAVLGVFAIAIGTLVRHTAGAITGIIGFVLVLSPLALLLPGKVGAYIHAYLPTVAGQQIATTVQAPGELLGPWQGFGVFCLWTAALMLTADVALRRRDG